MSHNVHPKLYAHFERLNALRLAELAAKTAAAEADDRHAEAFHARPWRPISNAELEALSNAAQDAAWRAGEAEAAYHAEHPQSGTGP